MGPMKKVATGAPAYSAVADDLPVTEVPEDEGLEAAAGSVASSPLGAKELTTTAGFIVMWYVCSIGLVCYNKWMFGVSGLGFPFPITVTAFHMITNSALAYGLLRLRGSEMYHHAEGFEWPPFLLMMAPVAGFTGCDIALSNTAFMYLDATFVEMVKPSSIIWLSLITVAIGLRKPSVMLFTCVGLMFGGQVIISANATSWDTKGFIIVSMAAVMAAFRATFMQLLLHGHKLRRKLLPQEVMLYAMPGSFLVLLLAAFIPYKDCKRLCRTYPSYCILHGNKGRMAGHHGASGSDFCSEMEILAFHGAAQGWAVVGNLVLAGAFLAFGLNFFEHSVVARSSALTLNAAAVVKLAFLFIATNLTLGESTSLKEVAGLVVAVTGVLLYNIVTRKDMEAAKSPASLPAKE